MSTISAGLAPSYHSLNLPKLDCSIHQSVKFTSYKTNLRTAANSNHRRIALKRFDVLAFSGGEGNHKGGGFGGGSDGSGGENGDGEEYFDDGNKREVLLVHVMERIPKDLKVAIQSGTVPESVMERYLELEKWAFFRWLMKFGGFKERLLADQLFFTKVGIECGVGFFTKTAAEYEKRRENFWNELEIVVADVVMAVCADFMLVYIPAPTLSIGGVGMVSSSRGAMAKFFNSCPKNAFQVAIHGNSYTMLQRIGAIVRNGAKLFGVGVTASMVGTMVSNAAINAKKAVKMSSPDHDDHEELHKNVHVPVFATSAAYGVYMAISSNLRYQIVAGVIEQRILEPIFGERKLILSAMCFAARTCNTFIGSLLWVDYARWIGLQKSSKVENILQ